jgi:hypothetical protein
VREGALELRGGDADSPLVVPAGTLAGAHAARTDGERLRGCPTIMLERRDKTQIRVGALGLGIVGEVLELVATLTASAAEPRAIVIVPLRKGAAARARELIAAGPPFDPATVGLSRHDVFVSEREAIFILEGPRISETVERLLGDVSLWRRVEAWRSCLGDRPRLAEHAYGWTNDSAEIG